MWYLLTLWLASVYFCYLLYCICYITSTHRTLVTYLVLAGFTHVSGVSWLSPSSGLHGSVLHSCSPSCLLAGVCSHVRGGAARGMKWTWAHHQICCLIGHRRSYDQVQSHCMVRGPIRGHRNREIWITITIIIRTIKWFIFLSCFCLD